MEIMLKLAKSLTPEKASIPEDVGHAAKLYKFLIFSPLKVRMPPVNHLLVPANGVVCIFGAFFSKDVVF